MTRNAKRNIARLLALSMVASQSISAFAVNPDEIVILEEEQISEIAEEEIVVESDLESGDVQEVGEPDESLEADGIEIADEVTDAEYDIVLSADEAPAEEFTYSSMAREFQQNVIELADPAGFEKMVEGVDYVANEVVAIAESEEEAQKIAKAYGGYLKSFKYGVAVIGLEECDYDVAKAYYDGMDQELNLPEVEPNYIYYLDDPVKDNEENAGPIISNGGVSAGEAWQEVIDYLGYDDPALNPANYDIYGYQWFHEMIGNYFAWWVTSGEKDIVVAVIDTGVYDQHEELAGKVIVPTDLKFNFDHNQDMVGHGTHVAGIIAAKAGNGRGGAGVAPDVSIMAINASKLNEEKTQYEFDNADIATAINYVGGKDTDKRRADIINMSLGGPVAEAAVKTAIDFANERGVTICASTGNKYSNAVQYPVGFDHVIGVGAVDQAGAKTAFSSFGETCDIAAPGADILSTYAAGKSSYTFMDGTSMATPVVSGVCALYMSAFGHQTPEKMEEILKTNAKKISSSGMGAGIVDLEKMMCRDAAIPKISLKTPDGKDLGSASNKTVTLKKTIPANAVFSFSVDYKFGKDGAYILYTTDGSDPVLSDGYYLNGELLYYDEWDGKTFPVKDIIGNVDAVTNLTIKAVAINIIGEASKVTTLKFKVDKTASATTISKVTITGQTSIVKGGNATYKAAVLPAKAKNKTVEWSVDDASKALGVTISNKGKLVVPDKVSAGTVIKVSAVSADKAATGTLEVTVTESKVNSIKISAPYIEPYNKAVYNKKTKSLTAATIFKVDIISEQFKYDERYLLLSAQFQDKSGKTLPSDNAIWKSSNEKVAFVNVYEGTPYVFAISKGTATITCEATDGSRKKATLKINVVVPASDISVTVANGQSDYISLGKSATAIANVGKTYGTPSSSKVNWSYKVGYLPVFKNGYYGTMSYLSQKDADDIVKNIKLFSLSKGKVKVGNQKKHDIAAQQYLPTPSESVLFYAFIFEVIATTTDGTNYSASRPFIVAGNLGSKLWVGDEKHKYNSLEFEVLPDGYAHIVPIYSDTYGIYEVTSSNNDVASAYTSGNKMYLFAKKAGTAKIKIRALDGSNKTCTVKVKIVPAGAK